MKLRVEATSATEPAVETRARTRSLLRSENRLAWLFVAPVIVYLKGGDEKTLLRAEKDAGQRTEGGAYLGADLIAQGQRARGIEILRKVLRDGKPGYFEYDLAYYELRRLGVAATRAPSLRPRKD